MPYRRQGAEGSGTACQDIKPAEALVERRPHPVDAVEIAQVEWHQRGLAAGPADLVVELFEGALRACDQDHLRALGCEAPRHRRADAA